MRMDLKNCTLQDLESILDALDEPKYRGKQIFRWIHKGVTTIDAMTNLPKNLREALKKKAYIGNINIEKILTSKLDGTKKYLFLLEDGNIIESVLMKYKHGNTVCVSCQVGCKMGCKFCASTLEGVIRNLSAGEMLDQVLMIQKDIGERISNVVLMGSGEPLDNYQEVLKFLYLINHPEGLNISLRNMTISTCGLVPQMIDLAHRKLQITLAISLHASNDLLRSQIMPINTRYPLSQLLKACKDYTDITNKRITFEYALIHHVNDREEHARELANKIKNILCHVNLIPLNPVDEKKFQTAKYDQINQFSNILKQKGIQTTIRRELGSDIHAACGQLRRRYLKSREYR